MISFYNVNNNIFFRNYQILNELKAKFCNPDNVDKLQLSEIGPRFSLCLMRILDGPMGGKTLYKNPFYIPPSTLIKKNSEKFKLRKIKEEREKEELNGMLGQKRNTEHNWLE